MADRRLEEHIHEILGRCDRLVPEREQEMIAGHLRHLGYLREFGSK